MDADALLRGLDAAQRHAVTTPSRPLVIRAAAGSGKTRVLTRRLAYRAATADLDPRRALCVTFTREAAGELRSRLRSLGLRDLPAAGTFHSVALGFLRVRWHDAGRAAPAVLSDRASLVAKVAPGRVRHRLARVTAEIDWARARGVPPARYPAAASAAGRRPGVDLEAVADTLARYEEAKRRSRLVDFDDLLERCAASFETDAAFAAAQRWRFRHLFIDEFQDVNPLQFRLLRAWLGEGRDLCVVGDPHQAIYGWNGAEPGLLDRLPTLVPGGEVVHLPANPRSTPQVVRVSSSVLGPALDGGPEPAEHRPAGPPPIVVRCADDDAEAAAVVDLLHRWHGRGVGWRHQAVLVRTNALARRMAAEIEDRGVPAVLAGGRGVPAAVLPPAASWAELWAELVDGEDPTLAALAAEYADLDPAPTPKGLAAWLRTVDHRRGGPYDDAVTVSTFHGAKGREWRAVVIAGAEDGLVPAVGSSRAGSALEAEERRLFYVALSRAGEWLACTWAASRPGADGRPAARRPSPYLADVEAACRAVRDADRPSPPPPGLSAGAGLAESDVAARRRHEALERWRAGWARAVGATPAAVLADAALADLAADPPADEDQLAGRVGVGSLRARRMGAGLLAALAAVDPFPVTTPPSPRLSPSPIAGDGARHRLR